MKTIRHYHKAVFQISKAVLFVFLLLLLSACRTGNKAVPQSVPTYCNPIDLSYRFCLEEPSRREAADPTVIFFRDRYFLFASKSGGYWHSTDLLDWEFIETNQIPTEEYAPTVIGIGDTLYFLASSRTKSSIYKSVDPLKGIWTIARETLEIPVWDPAFFLDDDGRLYLYWGCSNQEPLYGIELDYDNNFDFVGEPVALINANPAQHGWEVPGDYNTLKHQAPWIEGSWMNKIRGRYYLQYAGPGTEFKSYADAVYVADQPLGPYKLQEHNPFAIKPEGFAAGAGHGSTFADKYGNYWHIGTITISQKHMFERRLGLFPVFIDNNGTLYSITKYGDYPMIMPEKKIGKFKDIFPDWMLLSYGRHLEVSSSIDSLPPSHVTDENIRTYWAAVSGEEGEFAILDLGSTCTVNAIQVNFAEHAANIYGREKDISHKFTIESSEDKENWEMQIDASTNTSDNTHSYFQLPSKISCRYVKITNIEVPDGNFALSGFRIFGSGTGNVPGKISNLTVSRDPNDRRNAYLSWSNPGDATGYNIGFGTREDMIYNDYLVYGDTSLTISSLNTGMEYFFTIEAFNENGITGSNVVINTE